MAVLLPIGSLLSLFHAVDSSSSLAPVASSHLDTLTRNLLLGIDSLLASHCWSHAPSQPPLGWSSSVLSSLAVYDNPRICGRSRCFCRSRWISANHDTMFYYVRHWRPITFIKVTILRLVRPVLSLCCDVESQLCWHHRLKSRHFSSLVRCFSWRDVALGLIV